jgi:branched-chain amino acid transport system permease protein
MINRNNKSASKFYNVFSVILKHWQLTALIVIIIFFPLAVKSYFITRMGVILALYAINITGMTLLMRYAGVVSIGHNAFFAIGAYISALLSIHMGWNPWLVMLIAAAASVIFAYLFSVPFLKLRLIYLAMATMGLGEVVYLLSKDLTDITGGVAGIPEIPRLSIGGIALNKDWQIFYLFGLFLIVFVYLSENISRTRLGRAYHAIRTNETAAKAMGVNVQWELGKLFCFSALITSFTGSLLAHFITFISPESFTAEFSFTVLIAVIIGGANIWGALLTVVVLNGLSEAFRGLQDLSMGFYGLLLIISLFVFPDGISAALFPRAKSGKEKSSDDPSCSTAFLNTGKSLQSTPVVPGAVKRQGNILTLNNISKKFGGTEALVNVSFSVEYNQIIGIIGPNGAGKTTMLNIINGFITPLSGMIMFRNMDVTKKEPHEIARMGMGRTFQLVNLFKGMTVLENVMIGGHLIGNSGILAGGLNIGKPRREEYIIRGSALESLEFLGLMDKAYDLVDSLCFGEQRLVELARALTMKPDLLLLDEPAAGLNTAETEKLSDILQHIRERNITIVLVEHNMPLVMSVSDKIFCLDYGREIACGTPDHISKHKEVIRAYLGGGD